MDWWVTQAGRVPVGPVSTDLVLRGIEANRVPNDALVCEIGGTAWKVIGEVEPFAAALAQRHTSGRFDPHSEQTVIDLQPLETTDRMALDSEDLTDRLDEFVERTVVERAPFRVSEPPPLEAPVPRFDDPDEQTIADAPLTRPSEPPK